MKTTIEKTIELTPKEVEDILIDYFKNKNILEQGKVYFDVSRVYEDGYESHELKKILVIETKDDQ